MYRFPRELDPPHGVAKANGFPSVVTTDHILFINNAGTPGSDEAGEGASLSKES